MCNVRVQGGTLRGLECTLSPYVHKCSTLPDSIRMTLLLYSTNYDCGYTSYDAHSHQSFSVIRPSQRWECICLQQLAARAESCCSAACLRRSCIGNAPRNDLLMRMLSFLRSSIICRLSALKVLTAQGARKCSLDCGRLRCRLCDRSSWSTYVCGHKIGLR